MTPARRAPRGRVLGSFLILGLGLSAQPNLVAASQHSIFERLNASDVALARSVLQETLETRKSAELRLWRNEATGRSGSVMPQRTFKIKTGHFCREYRETVVAERKMESRDATACRTNDGIWIPLER